MKAILSADRKWGLGYQGRLLVSIPSDLRFFRETTMGHVVVMGRKTLATLPAGQPLKGRTNIIFSPVVIKGGTPMRTPFSSDHAIPFSVKRRK